MPSLARLAALLGGLVFCASAAAADVDAESYGFPLANPFEATIATTPPQLRPALPADDAIDQRDYAVRIRPDREFELLKNFWPVTKLQYRLAQQKGRAPLIFIIAGTGAHYSSGTPEYLKKLFYGAGFHVVQLSSPTSYDFMAAASRFATPGYTPDDADDLYRAMQAVRAQHPKLEVSEFHLTGYSLGGLHAAFVSQLDETRRAFDFKRVLLLNPPVNLYTSITNLDRLVQTQVEGIDNSTNFYDLVLGKLTRYFNEKGYLDINEAMLYDFQQSKEKLSDEQMAMLIGTVFRFAAADIVFSSDLLNRRGLITPQGYRISEGTSLTPFFQLALRCDFDCYIAEQLVPMWRARYDGGSLNQLIDAASLYALEDYLKGSDKVAVMHNADDLILGPGDIGFLRRAFGERLTLYPRGGHCGNLNYRVNSDAMLEFFRG
ncbi:serine/threonine protein kinase [Pseudomonas sp. AOB-7]|uniref:serine/threonine protein kinase n=1 Tax=Pseudomonas sp. AOB-7 TaxID=2482750 RepID=UPI000EFAA2E6|nr:serine/threonine protein kinase [Pseudomonas sp. AOB-7]RMH86943.1 serine/threonine protein kinase [Pseudomonas sp. AOB-7]